MRSGWIISGAGHLVFVLLALFGGLFTRDRVPDVTISEVALISEAEFTALTASAEPPETQTETPATAVPEQDAAPEPPVEDSPPEKPTPPPVEVPEAPAAPDITRPDPVPQAAIVEEAPAIDLPETEVDGSSLERDVVAAPAPRVAPTPSIAPPPQAEVAPDRVEDTAPTPEPEPEPTPEPEKPAAPEEASDRIVTEAEKTRQTAPASSKRPRSRPAQPVRQAETPKPAPQQPQKPDTSSAVAAALSQAATEAPPRSGPPLTGGEKDALRVSVEQCWNVGSLSTDALGTTVVVAVEMQQSGVPITDSIRLVSSSGGSSAGAQQAFEAARRAIIRCGARGFPLPVEKFGEWRDIEMTFNPEGMQFR